MGSRLVALACDARDPGQLARFWAGLLGRDLVGDARGPLLPGPPGEVALRFVPSDSVKSGQSRVHLHVTSETPEHQAASVTRALDLGGHHVDVGQRPEEGHVVLADPEGNELCVIEAGNAFLAGCGLLGELACDGTRAVGVFWSQALDWPLVWDQDEETAVQSPAGGTKIAWGGPPLVPKHGPNRQRLELATDDLDAEADRLVALGATRLASYDGRVELADPSDNELWLTRS
ncbi:VOC family protein [Nocardioides sp.]|uniref:VOC family protein n=1 Tax=Nocardioides sp. TaxID=35761 RepID=UPI0035299E07